jgi:hypothetical protein
MAGGPTPFGPKTKLLANILRVQPLPCKDY